MALARPLARAAIVTLATVGVIVAMLGSPGVLGVPEVKMTLGQVAKDAALRFQLDHRVCPSASRLVLTETSFIRSRKYQSRSDTGTRRRRRACSPEAGAI